MAKRRKNSRRSKTNKVDIQIVILFVISILLAILIYTKSGVLGENLSPVLGGMIGWMKYIIPIGTFIIAIYLVYDDKSYLNNKLIKYVLFLLCISLIMCEYQFITGGLEKEGEFWNIVKESYTLGEDNIGGGAIGAMLAIPLTKLLGEWGAFVCAIGLAIILLVFIFGMKPSEVLKSAIEKHEENKEERIKDREEKNRMKRMEKAKPKPVPVEDQIVLDDIKINIKEKDRKPEAIEENKKEEAHPNTIEANLFRQEQEQKEEKTKEVLVLEHALTVEDENYEFPPIELLQEGKSTGIKGGKKAVTDTATKLQKTLYSFGVSAKVENVSVGPAITRYELKPAEGVRVSKIANLADDIALSLAAETIRIEAPIPGKQAVGIEIPNKEKEIVHLRDIIDNQAFKKAKSKLSFALGKDAAGEPVVTDIAKMPHVLIAGSTGSRKECLYKYFNNKYNI